MLVLIRTNCTQNRSQAKLVARLRSSLIPILPIQSSPIFIPPNRTDRCITSQCKLHRHSRTWHRNWPCTVAPAQAYCT